ncbi:MULTISPECIES: putative 2-aminoethylphosphonate ABC transporter substrate-binding protein [unclassified Azospirillum]|uniref:putative 2-aminoethylphosphonate ABC transporter substrate-binding protein n=1 Tax=unclassified Azospirillum TaxID=2630922 RepID=UPI000B6E6913|nr:MULTISPECIES: putative 2-aminoethylphosphonate ABC transporter substrate-binding protein [unclassified Azospirillum]SNS14079.1 iron(III) transport system substrate-binding protein [Azospirillum sp. RU38E]SNS31233.1 iron(III) transport system substrate-binding protein [Azospirillum sp. RU37A]
MRLRRLSILPLALVALAMGLAAPASRAQEKTSLTVYTGLEADQLKAYKAAFEAANPSVEIRWVRDSNGVIIARLLAEKAAPKADVVMGVTATSLMLMDQEGMLEPYAPAGLAQVKPALRDSRPQPTWVGMDVLSSALCVSKVEREKLGLALPTRWTDLTDPAWKGRITMPNPASSGTGFLMVSAWLQMMGEEKGWAFMDALDRNIASYSHSGSKPCKQAATGEFAIGLSFEYRASKLIEQGAPLELVLPAEGLGWDMEAVGIVKGTPKLAAARTLLDWAVTPEANALYAQNFAIVARPEVQPKVPHIPADLESRLVKQDFAWAAANRDRILAEWSRRYDAKSEAK